jgi:hypothetical protein
MFMDAGEAAELFSTYAYNANESDSALGRDFAIIEILNDLASVRVKQIAESVGTPAVARDMLSIVEAFGQEKLQYWGISCVFTPFLEQACCSNAIVSLDMARFSAQRTC